MAVRRKATSKPARKTPEPVGGDEESEEIFEDETDEFEDEDPDEDFDDEDEAEDEEESDEAEEDDEEEEPAPDPVPPRESRAAPRTPKHIPGGRRRPPIPAVDRRLPEAKGEIFDISTWLSTAEAAKMVGRHPATIKNWRTKARIRAQLDDSGCWRHNPDDLVEAMESPEGEESNPAGVLAIGMESIVRQGDKAGDRLVAMTEVTTAGLERTCEILQTSLAAAHERIADLEKKLAEAYDRGMSNLEASYKHERWKLKMQHDHEEKMAERSESGTKLLGLLQVLGPIGATIATQIASSRAPANAATSAASPSRLDTAALPFEARLADAMARLDAALRELDEPTRAGFRLMLPDEVRQAIDAIAEPSTPAETRGKALGVVIRSAIALSPAQFEALRPVGPAAVVAVLAELRTLNEEKE